MKFMPLCKCSKLYHLTNLCTHSLASTRVLKPLKGYSGRYFIVLNSDSEYGLSLLTLGLEKELWTPNFSKVARKVAAFMGLPLSECNTNGFPWMPWDKTAFLTSCSAYSAFSVSQTS